MQIKAVTPDQAAAKNTGANSPAQGASKYGSEY